MIPFIREGKRMVFIAPFCKLKRRIFAVNFK
ncbi:MAG: hypothetical protein ACI8P3_002256, partial [Saprospiraceae bacterium]